MEQDGRRQGQSAQAPRARCSMKQLKYMVLDVVKSSGKRAVHRAKARRVPTKSITAPSNSTVPAAVSLFHQPISNSVSPSLHAATSTGSSAHIGQTFDILSCPELNYAMHTKLIFDSCPRLFPLQQSCRCRPRRYRRSAKRANWRSTYCWT